ncbi:MAG: flagellar basal body rod protein FlgC [Gammaproteobacteria bacterium]|nr:flagellar basal body rod protein FlgC [Gammaproteobacteria bacterium]NND39047.1 flagellar basal body rod protein FlgC [Pseudomonadales bacterium]
MSLGNVFDIAGMGMGVQTVRLNTIASNIANAETVAGSAQAAYRARHPVFIAQPPGAAGNTPGIEFRGQQDSPGASFGVMVAEIMQSDRAPQRRHQPGHPLADEQGYVYASNVNPVEEMADMIAASRSFQLNAEMANTAKSMMQRLLTLGQ